MSNWGPQQPAQARDYVAGCAAYGCPLPGGMSSEHGPGAKFFCRFHFRAAPADFDKITFKINQNLDRFKDLYNVQAGGISGFLQKTPDETGHAYRMRVEKAVTDFLTGKKGQ